MLRSVENRVQWLLHELKSFQDSIKKEELERLGFCGSKNEKILGRYTNGPAKDEEDIIIVTDFGLHLRDGNQWTFLDYKLMQEIRLPEGDKESWKFLVITFKDGTKINLPITNETKSESGIMGWDVFAFRKFLAGIISGINRAT